MEEWETRRDLCPYCRQECLIDLVHFGRREYNFSAWEDIRVGNHGGCYYLGECRHCGNPMLYRQPNAGPDEFPYASLDWPTWGELDHRVPANIRAIWGRAFLLQKTSPSAYITQLRRGLEAVLDDVAVAHGSLAARLDIVRRTGTLPAPIVDLADQLRQIGNAATHHRAEDLSYLYTHVANGLFRAIVDYVYVVPLRVAEARAALERLGSSRPASPKS